MVTLPSPLGSKLRHDPIAIRPSAMFVPVTISEIDVARSRLQSPTHAASLKADARGAERASAAATSSENHGERHVGRTFRHHARRTARTGALYAPGGYFPLM